jgi:hypothetical protein
MLPGQRLQQRNSKLVFLNAKERKQFASALQKYVSFTVSVFSNLQFLGNKCEDTWSEFGSKLFFQSIDKMSKRHPKNTFCFVYPPINTCFRERRN